MSSLLIVFKKEIKESFRDKKSLAMMLIIPILIPLIMFGMSALFDSEVNKDVAQYNKIGFSYQLTDVEMSIAKEMNIDVIQKDLQDLEEEYANGMIDLYITKEDNHYIMNGSSGTNTSNAVALMDAYFSHYKEYLQSQFLLEQNIDPVLVNNIITTTHHITDSENFFVSYITTYGFLFVIMAITVSATYPATDTTAGEKERGTLETLLTFPIKSKDIILGKFLGVTLSSIITGMISLILMVISLSVAGNMFAIYQGKDIMLSVESLIFAIIVIITYSLLISGLCIAIASKSKTFKEAQSALTPITFISFFPGMIAFMIDIQSSPLLSLVPFLNVTLLFEDIVAGNVNMIHILIMVLSTIVIVAVILKVIIKQYKSEKVLFSN